MNKHFHDSLYYLTRAAEHARLGVRESLDAAERRVRELTGRELEPEGRVDRIRDELAALERQAEGQAREAIAEARSSLGKRSDESA